MNSNLLDVKYRKQYDHVEYQELNTGYLHLLHIHIS